jgi:hypothetical protein
LPIGRSESRTFTLVEVDAGAAARWEPVDFNESGGLDIDYRAGAAGVAHLQRGITTARWGEPSGVGVGYEEADASALRSWFDVDVFGELVEEHPECGRVACGWPVVSSRVVYDLATA